MPVPVGPFPVPAIGVPLEIPVPSGAYSKIVIDNSSAYACLPNIAGPQHWLGAFCSDIYDVPPGATVIVTPTVALAAYAGVTYMTATFYTDSEPIYDSFPTKLTVTGTLSIAGSVTTATLPAMTTPVLTTTDPGAAVTFFPNVSPFTANASLGYLGITALFYAVTYPAGGTLTVAGTGWEFDKTTVTFPASANPQYCTFLAWKVIGGADLAGTAPITVTSTPGLPTANNYWAQESLYLGVAAGPWQNTSLAGAETAAMTWTPYGGTCPITTSLPAVYAAPIITNTANAPNTTVPGAFYAPSGGASLGPNPAGTAYGQLYYSAKSLTGGFTVLTTANQSAPYAASPQSGLIIPQ